MREFLFISMVCLILRYTISENVIGATQCSKGRCGLALQSSSFGLCSTSTGLCQKNSCIGNLISATEKLCGPSSCQFPSGSYKVKCALLKPLLCTAARAAKGLCFGFTVCDGTGCPADVLDVFCIQDTNPKRLHICQCDTVVDNIPSLVSNCAGVDSGPPELASLNSVVQAPEQEKHEEERRVLVTTCNQPDCQPPPPPPIVGTSWCREGQCAMPRINNHYYGWCGDQGACSCATCERNQIGKSEQICPYDPTCPWPNYNSYKLKCKLVNPDCDHSFCWGFTVCKHGACPPDSLGLFCFKFGCEFKVCGCSNATIQPHVANCSSCPCGNYCPSPSQPPQLCMGGTYCPPNSLAPINCTPGYVCPHGSCNQTLCPCGYKCPPGAQAMSKCAPPYYCPNPGATSMTLCPVTYYCPDVGMCAPKKCEQGTWNSCAGKVRCENCTAGRYCPDNNRTVLCPRRSYCPPNSFEPTPCPDKYYCPLGAAFPLPCPAKFYCPPGSGWLYVCPGGSYCPPSTSVPTPCDAGYVCPPGSSDQTLCNCGYRCPLGAQWQTQCGLGTYCEAGVTAAANCPQGHKCPLKGMCNATACEPGTYQSAAGKTLCLSCPTALTYGATVCP